MQIIKIDKQACKVIRSGMEQVVKNFATQLGLEGGTGSGRFSENEFILKIEFKLPIKPIQIAGTPNADLVSCGLAPRGTRVKTTGGNIGTIIDARRIKYVIKFDEDGKNWLVRFTSCTAI